MRDRLIELFREMDKNPEITCPNPTADGEACKGCKYAISEWLCDMEARKADHLIANGVTVQEWISVKDRLPDIELVEAHTDEIDLYACLATIKNERARGGRYVGKAWYDGKGFMDGDCVDITYDVTHWMPLPQPPKGE